MDVPKIMTSEEREEFKSECMKKINDFLSKRVDSINLKEVSGKFPQPTFMSNVDPFIRKLDKGMKLDYIINGYSSSGRKPMNQDPNIQEGFYIFGIKFTCPKCEEWMQPIRHDMILEWDGELIVITVNPDLICPYCRYGFTFNKSEIVIGEHHAKKEKNKDKKEELKDQEEIKKVDDSYSWP